MPAMRGQPERLVFIDETSVKTNLTRLRGRAPRGLRLQMNAPFGNWGTQTFIAGLTADRLIAPWVTKGAMDGPAFAAYVREVLVPLPAAILPGPEPHRAGLLETQGAPAQDRRKNLLRPLRCPWRHLRYVLTQRVLELLQGCWVCRRLKPKRFKKAVTGARKSNAVIWRSRCR